SAARCCPAAQASSTCVLWTWMYRAVVPVQALALGGEQRRSGPGVVGTEQAPHVLDEPPQATVRAVDQRHQPRLGPAPPRALAVADVQLAEPAQLPPHVIQ